LIGDAYRLGYAYPALPDIPFMPVAVKEFMEIFAMISDSYVIIDIDLSLLLSQGKEGRLSV
jgi:hypothetical protein